MVTLFTEQKGVLSVVARSARRSMRRFPSLEPMHLLRVGLEERPGGDVGTLIESSIARPRLVLVSSLDRLEAAGRALRWVRGAAPPHTPEPALWVEINTLLDRLDAPDPPTPPEALVAGMGLRLLATVGWGLDLGRCVRCGRTCDPGASAYLDPGEGGLVCRACGGGGCCSAASGGSGSSPRARETTPLWARRRCGWRSRSSTPRWRRTADATRSAGGDLFTRAFCLTSSTSLTDPPSLPS